MTIVKMYDMVLLLSLAGISDMPRSWLMCIGIGLFCFVLIILLLGKDAKVRKIEKGLERLRRSFNSLDEQAKLIVKTDLELNRAQDELDKRLNGLEALQRISRLISTTLDEKEIYQRLDKSFMQDLGFEKNLILIYERKKSDSDQVTTEAAEDVEILLHNQVQLGFSQQEIDFIMTNLNNDVSLMQALKDGNIFSSINSPQQRKEAIIHIFNVAHFILTPILTQNGLIGIVFVGNHSQIARITEGDQEVVSILSNQIGQSLENARLFEQVFRSSQILESRVKDRTKQLASALEEVQNISKTKSEFVSSVSHELRTPLTSIKGYAAILISGKLGEIPEAVKKRLEKINHHSDNLVRLINDLLDISRIESGRVSMNMGPCDIVKVVNNVEDLLTPQMKDKDIQWQDQFSPHIPDMILDSSQIERVFINLVGNAIKFTPEKGIIKVIIEFEKDTVLIKVSDTGIGIPEDDISQLFDEFYRVENKINQNVKGTGLGLAVTKKIVEAHKGKIWVTSEVGKGTTFHIVLPINIEKIEQKE